MDIQHAALWCAQWADQLTAQAQAMGQDTDTAEFNYKVALGMLAVGIEYGRGQARGDGLT